MDKLNMKVAEEKMQTVREDYVQKMRDNYLLIMLTIMHDFVVSVDKDGKITFVNDATTKFFGKSRKKILGTHFSNYLDTKDVKKAVFALEKLIENRNQVEGFVLKVKTPKGLRTVAWNGVAVFDEAGNHVGAQAIGKDLTDIMRVEEELEQSKHQFKRLFEVIVDPIVIVDLAGKILDFSQSAEKVLGFPREELVGKHFLETDAATDETKKIMEKNLERIKKGNYIKPHIVEAVTKDGRKLLYELIPARLDYKGNPAILAIFRNITEQRKAEEKLQESEERFKNFLYNAPEAIWVQDTTGTFVDGNKKAEEITGYKRKELIGKNILDINFVPAKYVPQVIEAFQTNQRGERSGPTELELIKKDGSLVHIEASSIPVERDGKIEIIGIARDISNRKQAEAAVQESENRFRELSELLPEIIFETDVNGGLTFVNEAAFDRFGYSPKDLEKGLNAFQMIAPEDRKKAKNDFNNVLSGTDIGFVEYAAVRKDETTFPVMIHSAPIIRRNKLFGLRGIIVDITDRKKTEEALKKSEERFRSTLDGMIEGCQIIDYNWRCIYINDTAVKHARMAKKAILGKTLMEVYPGIEKSELFSLFRQCMEERVPVHTENELTYLSDGTTAWFELSIEPVPEGIFVLSIDITDRKKAEEARKKSEERFRNTLDSMMEGCQIIDYDWRYVYVNDAVLQHSRLPKKDFLGKTMMEMYPEIEKTELFSVLRKCMKERVPMHMENRFQYPDGKTAWFELSIEPVPEGIFVLSIDITDRKEIAEALRQQREMLETVTANINAGLVVVSKDYRVLWANEVLKKYLGEIEGKLCYSSLNQQKDICHGCGVKEIFETGKDWVVHEHAIPIPDGKEIWLEVTATAIRDETGKIVAASEMSWDITERKKLENELKESLHKFRTIFEGATDGILAVDPKTERFVFANPQMCNITGYPLAELLKLGMPDIHRKEDLSWIDEQFQNQMVGKLTHTQNIPFLRKDKTIIYCDVSSRLMKIGNDQYLVGFFRDATERRKAEKEIQDLAKFPSENPTPVVRIKDDGSILYANKAAQAIMDKIQQEDMKSEHNSLEDAVRRSLSSGITETVEVDYINQTFSFVVTPIHDAGYVNIYGRDITDRKQLENKLKESLQKFKTIFEGATDGIVAINPKTMKFEFANSRLVELTGSPFKELLKSTIIDYVPKDEIPLAKERFQKQLEGKLDIVKNQPILRKDKTLIYCDISANFLKIGKQDYIIAFLRDVTEQKKAEDALRASEEKYRELINGMNDTAIVLDFNGKIIDANKTAVEVLGYSREELLSTGPQLFDAALTVEQIKNLVEKMKNSEFLVFETVHTTKGGKTFPVEVSASRVNYQGKDSIISIARDITVRKKVEEALRASEEKYREIINAMNDTAWVIDLEGGFIDVNDAAVKALGYSREELLTMGPQDLSKDIPKETLKNLIKQMPIDKRQVFEATHFTKDGKKIPVEISSSLVTYQGKRVILSIARDITERKKAQLAIDSAMHLLKESNKELESYTYVVSHDLKAPLRTVRSFGSFLLEDYGDKLDETGKDYLNRMVNASSHMDTLIEDLLVLSRVGRKYTEFEKVDLNNLLEEILADLEMTIKERNAKIVVDKLPVLFAQRVWIKQLFMNLISNALKFNESKIPKIEVLYQETKIDHMFTVQDNGIGIEKKYLERIFNLFERAPTKKKYEGTGAGLSICKKIVEQLGGKIWVESTLGKGSKFMFNIPKEIKKEKEL